jgi:N6-L-threonylcarbamoyladenine synthase
MSLNHFLSNSASITNQSAIVLGIEASCDETALAIIQGNQSDIPIILAENLFSQIESHAPYGGVVPEIAARAHAEKIPYLLKDILIKANIDIHQIDAIAATSEPGLIGGVLVGLMVAKGICVAYNKPLIAVNHLEGHALSPKINQNIQFPYLLLLVSGGHCQILIVYNINHYELLGTTIDDSAGEAFDKVAKMLEIGFPGGPIVEEYAKLGNPKAFSLPRPMIQTQLPNFSFSGLKTAILRITETEPNLNKHDLCASFQMAVSDCLINRMKIAMTLFKEKTNLPQGQCVVAGGVAANMFLRSHLEQLCQEQNFNFFAPPLKYCTDNGVMIAYAGLQRFLNGHISSLDYKAKARSPLGIKLQG